MAAAFVRRQIDQWADKVCYLHELGFMPRDLKLRNVLLRNLDPLEVVICNHGFAQRCSGATISARSGLWSAPECLWGLADSGYDCSVDMYSMGVILLWLIGVYAENGEYKNEMNFLETSFGKPSVLARAPKRVLPFASVKPWRPILPENGP